MDTSSPVPIVDFGEFLNGSEEKKSRVAERIDTAFREVGFVFLKNHGVDKEMVEECFEWVRISTYFGPPTALMTPLLDLQSPGMSNSIRYTYY